MVNLGQKQCFSECPSLCSSGFDVGKRKLHELWEAEVKPPCSEHHGRLEAMKDRCRGTSGFQFGLELFHCVPAPPSRLPALLTNRAHYQMLHANSEMVATKKHQPRHPVLFQQLDMHAFQTTLQALTHSPKPGLLSGYSLILQQPFLDPYILSSFPYCISPHPYKFLLP